MLNMLFLFFLIRLYTYYIDKLFRLHDIQKHLVENFGFKNG